ncbi:hypothetical protein [Solemya velesiana gill symbiont]|uniref:Uncharacterized protein n=1 Tax=Solemya velesiana gill symbiont TaxID=1918948 RepID=A0A1T2KTK7_9GAMM|nr:hypothetical protein [Solemya velesiana gill symbiont]OOZ36131.1 hypothetical protein BOW51_08805 [Solemya velesiana gill symbiont]
MLIEKTFPLAAAGLSLALALPPWLKALETPGLTLDANLLIAAVLGGLASFLGVRLSLVYESRAACLALLGVFFGGVPFCLA